MVSLKTSFMSFSSGTVQFIKDISFVKFNLFVKKMIHNLGLKILL
jgi:hypothetical protein